MIVDEQRKKNKNEFRLWSQMLTRLHAHTKI